LPARPRSPLFPYTTSSDLPGDPLTRRANCARGGEGAVRDAGADVEERDHVPRVTARIESVNSTPHGGGSDPASLAARLRDDAHSPDEDTYGVQARRDRVCR